MGTACGFAFKCIKNNFLLNETKVTKFALCVRHGVEKGNNGHGQHMFFQL
jgi:hypothetical protein